MIADREHGVRNISAQPPAMREWPRIMLADEALPCCRVYRAKWHLPALFDTPCDRATYLRCCGCGVAYCVAHLREHGAVCTGGAS